MGKRINELKVKLSKANDEIRSKDRELLEKSVQITILKNVGNFSLFSSKITTTSFLQIEENFKGKVARMEQEIWTRDQTIERQCQKMQQIEQIQSKLLNMMHFSE